MTSWPATHDTKTTIICSSNLTWPATHKNHQGSPHVHVTWHHRQRTKTIKNPACSCKWHHRQHTMTTAPLKAHLSWPHHTMSSLAHNVIGTHTHTHIHTMSCSCDGPTKRPNNSLPFKSVRPWLGPVANVQAAAGPKLMRGGYPPELNLGLQNMTALRVVFLNDLLETYRASGRPPQRKKNKDDKRKHFTSIWRPNWSRLGMSEHVWAPLGTLGMLGTSGTSGTRCQWWPMVLQRCRIKLPNKNLPTALQGTRWLSVELWSRRRCDSPWVVWQPSSGVVIIDWCGNHLCAAVKEWPNPEGKWSP